MHSAPQNATGIQREDTSAVNTKLNFGLEKEQKRAILGCPAAGEAVRRKNCKNEKWKTFSKTKQVKQLKNMKTEESKMENMKAREGEPEPELSGHFAPKCLFP